MKKNSLIVTGVIIGLAAAVAVLALHNRANTVSKKEAQDSGVFFVRAGGEEYTVTTNDFASLSAVELDAGYRKSGRAPETRTYRGVSFKAVLGSLGIDVSPFRSVSFTAADGYASALSIEEAMDDTSCYIVNAMDGRPLGTKADGGSGPFMMILTRDPFSNRWCKFLLEVRLQ